MRPAEEPRPGEVAESQLLEVYPFHGDTES
jgi:hypothetical protein